jgi:nucleoside-diphosphate-sugar epimerase
MQILVIGGTRFVGPRLVRSVLERGHAVTTFNRGRTPDFLPADVKRLHGERSDTAGLMAALAGRSFDACVDTIAMRGGDTAAAIDVLDGRVGHYVHFSTGQVYLVREGCPSPAREDDYAGTIMAPPPESAWDHGQWTYGVEKRECEDLLEQAWAARGFPATRLRLTMVHGEDDPRERIGQYVHRLREGGPLLVPVEPSPPIRPIDADTVVETVVRLLEGGLGKGGAYNLAQDEFWTHDEFVAHLAAMLQVEPVVVRRPRGELIEAGMFPDCALLANPWMSVLDAGRAREALGFEPPCFADWLPSLVERVSALPPPPGFQPARVRELSLAAEI